MAKIQKVTKTNEKVKVGDKDVDIYEIEEVNVRRITKEYLEKERAELLEKVSKIDEILSQS